MCLSGNGTYPKLKVFVRFGAQFTPEKPKILQKKTEFSLKLLPYDYQITQVPGPR